MRSTGRHYRISLDREVGRHIDNKTDAEKAATNIRAAIHAGTFRMSRPVQPAATPALTFRAFAEVWKKGRGKELVSAPIDAYRLATICDFIRVDINSSISFGDRALEAITLDDIETIRDARKSKGLGAVSINHDLRLLGKMFNWGIRKGYVPRTPFKIGSEPAIALEREIPRHKRFSSPEVEETLLKVANPHLRAVITALLDTACRPGEILSLQWVDVSLLRRELTIRAEKENTRRERIIPASNRLLALLELRQHDPAGRKFGSDKHVFGDAVGRHVKSVHGAWKSVAAKAGLDDFSFGTCGTKPVLDSTKLESR